METKWHIVISLILGAFAYSMTDSADSIVIAAATFLSGVLIDIDHLLDYLLYLFAKRKNVIGSFDWNEFNSGTYFKKSGKIYVLLHSYELVAVLAVIGFLLPPMSGAFCLWIAASALIHILADQFYYPTYLLSYFLAYRIAKKFEARFICDPSC